LFLIQEETRDQQTIPDDERLFRYDEKLLTTEFQTVLSPIASRLIDVSIPNLRLCLGRLSFTGAPRSCVYRIEGLNHFALFGEAFIFPLVKLNCLITLVRGSSIRTQVLRVPAVYSNDIDRSFVAFYSILLEGKLKYS
jgi:hypothetical protein